MRELNWRLNSIYSRKNLDMKFEAKLHGMEIKAPVSNSKPVKLDEREEKNIEAAFKAAKLRKAKKHGK